MNKTGIPPLLLQMILMFLVSGLISAQADEPGIASKVQANTIAYDKSTDHLRVAVETISLKLLLGKIAMHSGMEVLFDDAAEDTVSIDIESVSLEKGLKNILRGRNYILGYGKDEKGKLLLTSVQVLPAGSEDAGRAERLVAIDNEAYNRALSQMSLEQVNEIDMANERWQSRMRNMPPEYRQAMENRVKKRIVAREKRKQINEERKLRREQKQARLKARHEKVQEAIHRDLTPEQREAKQQRSREAQEQIKAQVLPQLQSPQY